MTNQSSPYFYTWRPDFRQNPFLVVRQQVDSEIEDVSINQTPLRDNYRNNDIRVILKPRVIQDRVDIPQGDSVKYGVAQPGSLYARLNASLSGERTQNG